jgi:hypothetical protein
VQQHYETSLSAYILLQEVIKELNIRDTLEECSRNGKIKRILLRCNRIIAKRYPQKEQQIKLRTYIENIFNHS